MNILAIEASTTSGKAMLYNTDNGENRVLSRAFSAALDPVSPDADGVFGETMQLARRLAESADIDIITLSGTWHSLLACDGQMHPLTPAYLWNFTGASEVCQRLRRDSQYTNDFYHRTGCMVNAIYPTFKIKWLLENSPALKSSRFMSLGAYITYRMTGQLASTVCMASGSGLMDISTRSYSREILSDLGLSESQLVPLVDYREVFTLNEESAALLGLRAGIPVIPSNPDGGLNQVGAGALKNGTATLSIGTSGATRISTDKPAIPDVPSTWCYMSPRSYLAGASTNGCCNCIDWAKDSLFPKGTSYQDIEGPASKSADAPFFMPFLFGERCPGWNDSRLGGFCGILPSHTNYDLYRAVQEGVLFNIYHCFEALANVAGNPSEIRLSGGIISSPAWTQMCADIFGREMTVDETSQQSLMGACVVAMEILGVIPSMECYTSPVKEIVKPDEEAHEKYRKKFEKYLEHYNRG